MDLNGGSLILGACKKKQWFEMMCIYPKIDGNWWKMTQLSIHPRFFLEVTKCCGGQSLPRPKKLWPGNPSTTSYNVYSWGVQFVVWIKYSTRDQSDLQCLLWVQTLYQTNMVGYGWHSTTKLTKINQPTALMMSSRNPIGLAELCWPTYHKSTHETFWPNI